MIFNREEERMPLEKGELGLEYFNGVVTHFASDLENLPPYLLEVWERRPPRRRKLPDERQAITHKFCVSGHEGYLTAGLYEDGQLGEIFIVMAKEGSTLSGVMDAFATAISIGLQSGVPLRTFADKFINSRFEPYGFTENPKIPLVKSITDYIFRWLVIKFLSEEDQKALGLVREEEVVKVSEKPPPPLQEGETFRNQADAPSCLNCGAIMVRSGTCYKCTNCGSTSGCS